MDRYHFRCTARYRPVASYTADFRKHLSNRTTVCGRSLGEALAMAYESGKLSKRWILRKSLWVAVTALALSSRISRKRLIESANLRSDNTSCSVGVMD